MQLDICECDFGYYLNLTFCVNVIQQFSITQKNATNLENTLKNELQRSEIELKHAFIGLEQLIISNITTLALNMMEDDKEIIEDIVSTNRTIHQNVDEMRAENTNQFSALTDLIGNNHMQTLNYLTNTNTTLSDKLDVQTALIDNNQLSIKNNFTAIINTMATQVYLKSVYDNLIGTVSAKTQLQSVYDRLYASIYEIVLFKNKCKAWPNAVNENGLCKCFYKSQVTYCPKLNQCCHYALSENINSYVYTITCGNGFSQTVSDKYQGNAINKANIICGDPSYYTNQ
ncbi:Hypothetical_protein [Hexamita inflata]|uniref:Hypothetical_protein n=1 Tax=Hexamita inflata TaxID=28002 RepID=A0AA86P0D6_9EUKA|nr:Hypothetical protein HINF_LOCUS16896 [Hexamita inflata]